MEPIDIKFSGNKLSNLPILEIYFFICKMCWESNGTFLKMNFSQRKMISQFRGTDIHPAAWSIIILAKKKGYLRIPYQHETAEQDIQSMISYTPQKIAMGIMSNIIIPAQTWAIFPSDPFTWDKFDETIETYINDSSPNGFLLLDTNRSMEWILKLQELKRDLISLSYGLQ
ncbi:hypothetical protein J14TS5_56710 [Paenibacillus lautus]|uniref:hypothetical protein n=1 Tax=Paenibacillus lautus TaxID=1401 RepID=UPI001B2B7BA6|nr:hypothetical protein J14TS5_56710 [Paenibacillus lautus]